MLRDSTKDLTEHELVVDHYRQVLGGVCSELSIPDAPRADQDQRDVAPRHPGAWHAARPQLLRLDLALMLHPTPGGRRHPTDDAIGIINEVEEPRCFYAGFVGWCNDDGDGEYMVSIRCAEVAGATARAWAGGGVIASSSPAAEAAETTAKLQTALAGAQRTRRDARGLSAQFPPGMIPPLGRERVSTPRWG
jgi:isochorismate synthase